MSEKTDTQRIDALEKRVSELKEQVLQPSSFRLFAKAFIAFFTVGTFFLIWKCRNILKWAFLGIIAWLFLGGYVCDICSATGAFISNTWVEMRQENKMQNAHERDLERINAEASAANSKMEADANARIQVLNAEESVKQKAWERTQTENRNDAINEAIRKGTWNNSAMDVSPVTSSLNNEIKRPKVERTVSGNTTKVVVKF